MKKAVSPSILRQQSDQLARRVESGLLNDKQAVKKLTGLLQRKGKPK